MAEEQTQNDFDIDAPLDSTPDVPLHEESHETVAEAARAALDRAKAPIEHDRDTTSGRFVKREGEDTGDTPKPAQRPPQAQETPSPEKPEEAPQPQADAPLVLKPPVGWSAAARAAYGSLPREVQESVAKREQEINKGFAVLQDYKGLDQYTPLIKASGITHAEFTRRAVEWEQALKANPVNTLFHVAKLGNIDMRRLAQSILQQPGQPQQPQRAAPPPQPQPNIQELVQREIATQRSSQLVEDFLADPANVHAEALADDMALLISNGRAKDLRDAYDMASWAHPEIRAQLIKQQSAQAASKANPQRIASQARAAAKATTGAPVGDPAKRPDAPPATVRDAVRRAYQAQLDAD